MLPDPDLKPKHPWNPLKTMVNNLRSIAGVDPYNRDRVLRTDLAGNLSVVIATGLGIFQKEIRWWQSGNLTAYTGPLNFYNLYSTTLAFQEVHLAVGTAPTGADLICDINKGVGGLKTSIFTSANRPTIAAGEYTGKSTTFDITTFNDDDYLTIDIDQVGSGAPGSNLVVTILFG
jgi:hypothetical protein